MGESTLIRHNIDENGVSRINALVRRVNGGERLKFSEIVERLDEFMVETPATEKVEEPTTTEQKEEITATDKEVVSKTTDGRAVYEGEEVYKVQKGDCLWAIAKKFLGNGAKYKELFTRNNGIIEKAELIFPGQKIIYIPAK